jgi:hypothetical protein
MNKKFWSQSFESSLSSNLKSKTCTERSRSIQNRKLGGIVALVVTLAICGAVAQAICAFVSLKAGIQNSPGLVDELKGHVPTVWLALRPQTDIKGHKRINMEGCDV